MKYAVVNQHGAVVAEFETCPDARAYTDLHARSITVYTRSGKRPGSDLHVVKLERLAHYRAQLEEARA